MSYPGTIRRSFPVIALALLASPPALRADEPLSIAARTDAALRAAIEMPQVPGPWLGRPQFTVSPDHRQVAYIVQRGRIADNSVEVNLWVAALTNHEAPRLLTKLREQSNVGTAPLRDSHTTDPNVPINPSFSADGRRIALVGVGPQHGSLAMVDIATGRIDLVTPAAGPRWAANSHVDYEDVLWSPRDPNVLAVVFGEERPMDLNHGVEVSTEWEGRSLTQAVSRIAVINVATREVLAETSADLDVSGYGGALSWSPDGMQIAFSARRAEDPVEDGKWTDLFLLDVNSGVSRALIARDGLDMDPRWSPDGRAIAFLTDGGIRAWHRGSGIGIYDLETRKIRAVPLSDDTTRSSYGLSWYDKDTVMFVGMRRMTCPLFMASAREERVWQLSPDDLSCMGAGVPGPEGSILSVSHSFAHPGALIQSARAHWAPVPIGPAAEGTLPAAEIRTLSWKSSDRRFSIPGLLITPRDGRAGRRPLLVSIAGGPSMVEPDIYNANAQQLIYPALLRGFAILVPNTRGRGGYGEAFAHAIADNKDQMPGPFTDVMTGVDLLVDDLDIADPDRMAAMGFSYGGVLSSYIAAHTHRFKAIIAGEGAVEFLAFASQDYGSIRQLGEQAMFGVSNPYDPMERAILTEQSPITHAADVRTPLLLECGVLSLAGTECVKFFRAVRLTGTPTTLAVYPRSGHGLFEPGLRYDSAVRETAWIDHWVLGMAGDVSLEARKP